METYQVELKVSCRGVGDLSSYFNTIIMMAKGFGLTVEESEFSLPKVIQPVVVSVPKKRSLKRFINVDEAAEYLGLKKNTIYRYVHIRKIPFYKIGSRTQFDISELDEWISSRKEKVLS